ncbi:MAG: biopolymer transporter ExbD [Spirochaetales bacterium]|nr:biopolymer transporter ExbD [Spirochaetales bacterium]
MSARKLEWKKIKRDDGESTPLLITPLIDIMFLLLIFFVMNTSFNKLSPIDINMPESQAPAESVQKKLTLILKENNAIVFQDRNYSLNELYEALTSTNDKTGEVIIAGDERISYAFLVAVMDEAGRAGFSNITLLTESD